MGHGWLVAHLAMIGWLTMNPPMPHAARRTQTSQYSGRQQTKTQEVRMRLRQK